MALTICAIRLYDSRHHPSTSRNLFLVYMLCSRYFVPCQDKGVIIAGDEHAAPLAWSTAVVREQLLLLEHPATAAAIPLRSPLTSSLPNLKVEPQYLQLNPYCRCPEVELEGKLTKKGVWVAAAPQDSTLSRGRDISGRTRSRPYSRYKANDISEKLTKFWSKRRG